MPSFLAWKDRKTGEIHVRLGLDATAEQGQQFRQVCEAGKVELPVGDYTSAKRFTVNFKPKSNAPAPVAVPRPGNLFRKCRCCGRINIHTTAPHLGCDDCV